MTQPPPLETDASEAVDAHAGRKPARRHLRARWIAAAVVVALLASGGFGLWRSVTADADGDGLTDRVESSGWVTQDGSVHQTNPDKADTDGDGLTDADEAGALASTNQATDVYVGYSDPLRPDTDSDDLPDGGEADLGLDPQDRDSDDDTLRDGYEIEVVGTDPDVTDTDGDGFNDGYEDSNREGQGLDPLIADAEVSKAEYIAGFAKGALAGDLWREDSLAWIAGNLASGGTTAIPVVGQIAGAATDLRDAVGSAIQGDWVGSGFSALGAVPGGDVVAIPGKAAKFIARNPQLAAAVAALIARARHVPGAIKLKAAQQLWPSWDDLVRAGASEKALLQLQKGTSNLDDLAAVIRRPNHIAGMPSGPFPTGQAGEASLGSVYGARARGVDQQVRASTAGCLTGCNSSIRIFDVLVNGIAHESKVGRVSLTQATEGEIRKDAWLIQTGQIQGAHWHFYASSSSNTIGATAPVYQLLDELGIPYTIHLPG